MLVAQLVSEANPNLSVDTVLPGSRNVLSMGNNNVKDDFKHPFGVPSTPVGKKSYSVCSST